MQSASPRKVICAFIALVVLAVGASAQEHKDQGIGSQLQKEWITYTSAAGRFSVTLPQQPKLSEQESTGGNGGKFTQYLAGSEGENIFLMVGYFDYGTDTTFSLTGARDGMVDSVKGTLVSDEVISLGAAPGRQIKIAAKSESQVEFFNRARFYDFNRRVYVLQCLFTRQNDTPAIASKCEQFFSSFKVQSQP